MHIEQRRKPKLRPAPVRTGASCPRCGDRFPYKIVGGREICVGCGKRLPTARQTRVYYLWRAEAA